MIHIYCPGIITGALLVRCEIDQSAERRIAQQRCAWLRGIPSRCANRCGFWPTLRANYQRPHQHRNADAQHRFRDRPDDAQIFRAGFHGLNPLGGLPCATKVDSICALSFFVRSSRPVIGAERGRWQATCVVQVALRTFGPRVAHRNWSIYFCARHNH